MESKGQTEEICLRSLSGFPFITAKVVISITTATVQNKKCTQEGPTAHSDPGSKGDFFH